MAKIAAILEAAPTTFRANEVAHGDGWTVSEMLCSLGPHDRPFEEQHSSTSIAVVAEGSFQYRSHTGCELMTPGSLMLGSQKQNYECSHEHGTGDRCISFSYSADFLDRVEVNTDFRAMRIPRLRDLSPLIARISAALAGAPGTSWEEVGIELAAQTSLLDRGCDPEPSGVGSAAIARVARVVRTIESEPEGEFDLSALAQQARLSPYHFLRTFQAVTGVTPHQYLLRVRLQRAAVRLRTHDSKVVDIAFESGFGDVSNFNRTFRAEFGVSPRAWRTKR